jgi:hypothetical protein
MIPIPPTHCVVARQISIACESTPGSANTVAPVVVNPAAVSNSGSTRPWSEPLSRYGSVPKTVSRNHASATTAKPSLEVRIPFTSVCLRPSNQIDSPSAAVTSSARTSAHSW